MGVLLVEDQFKLQMLDQGKILAQEDQEEDLEGDSEMEGTEGILPEVVVVVVVDMVIQAEVVMALGGTILVILLQEDDMTVEVQSGGEIAETEVLPEKEMIAEIEVLPEKELTVEIEVLPEKEMTVEVLRLRNETKVQKEKNH